MITWFDCKNTIDYIGKIIQYIKHITIDEFSPIVRLYDVIKSNTDSKITLDLNLKHINLAVEGLTDLLSINAVIPEDAKIFNPNYIFVKGEIFGDEKTHTWLYAFTIYDNNDDVIHRIKSEDFKSIYFDSINSELYVAKQFYDSVVKDKEIISENALLALKNIAVQITRNYKKNYLSDFMTNQINTFISDYYDKKIKGKIDFKIINKKHYLSTIYPTI